VCDNLHFQAAADGDTETLQELVFKFGQVSIPNDSLINMYNTLGYTMLHYAVMYKRMDCITTLIELGAGMCLIFYLIRTRTRGLGGLKLSLHRNVIFLQNVSQ